MFAALSELDARPLEIGDFRPEELPVPFTPEDLDGGGNWALETSAGRIDIMQWVPGIDGGYERLRANSIADDVPAAVNKLRQEIEVMLGLRRGNAFRNLPAHHHRSDRRTVGQSDRKRPQSDRPTVRPSDHWEPPVLATVATTGEGVAELAVALDRHRTFLDASGRLVARRRERLAERTRAVVERGLRQWVWEETPAPELLAQQLPEMAEGRRSPYDVAADILEQLRSGAIR